MDYYTKHGAGLLANRIRYFWRARGFYGITCDLFELSPGTWAVRSNIGPKGFPPKW